MWSFAGDFVPFWDITATATNKKITFANFEAALNHNALTNYAANEHFTQANITAVGTIASGTWQGTTIAINQGGTGQITAQLAINALSAVSGATNEHVLTKDTETGNATWKAAAGGAASTWIALTDTDPANYTGEAGNAVVVNAGEDGLEFGAAPGGAGGGDPEGDVPVTVDSESNTLAKDHAYKAQTAGFVDVRCIGNGYLLGYVGITDNPLAGTNLQYIVGNTGNEGIHFFVAKDKYFEISSELTVYIHWTPLITGGGAPIDQD